MAGTAAGAVPWPCQRLLPFVTAARTGGVQRTHTSPEGWSVRARTAAVCCLSLSHDSREPSRPRGPEPCAVASRAPRPASLSGPLQWTPVCPSFERRKSNGRKRTSALRATSPSRGARAERLEGASENARRHADARRAQCKNICEGSEKRNRIEKQNKNEKSTQNENQIIINCESRTLRGDPDRQTDRDTTRRGRSAAHARAGILYGQREVVAPCDTTAAHSGEIAGMLQTKSTIV